ncbi:MAG: hypothetical protein AAGE76_13000 [Pseudomonadota bacterium]
MSTPLKCLAAAALMALSACGDTFAEQSLFGAGVGAATADITGANAGTGAPVGAALNVGFCDLYPRDCASRGF